MKQKLKKIETKIRESNVLKKIIGSILMLPGIILAVGIIGWGIYILGTAIWETKGLVLLIIVLILGLGVGIIYVTFYGYDLMVMIPMKKTKTDSNKKVKGKPNKNGRKK